MILLQLVFGLVFKLDWYTHAPPLVSTRE